MRRSAMAVLCLAFAGAASTIGTSAASAATQPLVAPCIQGTILIWPYEDARCSVLAAGEKGLYRKEPLANSTTVAFTSANKMGHEPQFKAKNREVKCEKSKGSGEVIGVKPEEHTELLKVSITYEKCKGVFLGVGVACENFTTKELKGRLGYTVRAEKLVGSELEPVTGFIAKFNCGATAVEFTGCSIGEDLPVSPGIVEPTLETVYKENAEKNGQQRTEIEGGTHKPCRQEATFGGTKETMWSVAEEVLTWAKELELQA
jgi:hypothetical protein